MSALSARWTQATAKFAALSRRERGIVAAALLIGGGFLGFSFGIEPLLLQARGAARTETAARAELARQQAQVAALQAQNADPDAPSRRRLTQARQELASVGERLARFEAGMVSPARMPAFLQGLLAQHPGVELLGLKTLPATPVGAAIAAPPAASAASTVTAANDEGIYQHGIEIKLAGSYHDLLNYLTEVERMPQRVMWNSISLAVEKYPRNIVVLRVYTLSLERNWLAV